MKGRDQTEKKIFKFPLIPIVLKTSKTKWKITPVNNPIRTFKNCFFVLDFLIDNEQPNITIVKSIRGKEKR